MPNISSILCDSFLSNFNYCDATGKRSNTSKWKRHFLNKGLTQELETLANQTAQNIRDIHALCKADNQERVPEITQIINNTIDKLWELRLRYGHTSSYAGGHRPNGVPTHGGSTTSPRRPSKFEKDFDRTLKAMHLAASRALLDKKSGPLENLDDFRDAIANLWTEQKALKSNRSRTRSESWAE